MSQVMSSANETTTINSGLPATDTHMPGSKPGMSNRVGLRSNPLPLPVSPIILLPALRDSIGNRLLVSFSRLKIALQQGQWVLALSEAQLPLALLICGVVFWFGFRWGIRIFRKRLRERAAFREEPLHIQELHLLLAQMDRLMGKHQLVRKPGETLMQFSRRIQDQKISEWYAAYASSRFMPESATAQELIVQLKQQLQEFRNRKSLV